MTLEWPVVGLLLLAALLHASWNAIAKASGDPLVAMAVVTATGGLFAALFAPAVSFPARAAWPFLAASVVLHLAYQLFLVTAYRLGDLSQVYPIARGLAPCAVAALAFLFSGEVLAPRHTAGLLLASAAIASLALAGGPPSVAGRRAAAAAVTTALLIGSYTFVDGLGVRRCESPFDYVVWSFVFDGLPIAFVALAVRGRTLLLFPRATLVRAAGGGVLSVVAYGIVLWALSRGAMGPVAALRETSVVFAAVIGTRLLGEPFGARRVAAAAGVAAGIALLQS